MKAFKGQDKRKYLRLDKNLVISYVKEKKVVGYDLSQSYDVGQGGLLFNSSEKFEKGDILSLLVRFPFMQKRTNLLGEVVGSQKVKKNLYETRVKFLDLSGNMFNKLTEYMKSMKKQEILKPKTK